MPRLAAGTLRGRSCAILSRVLPVKLVVIISKFILMKNEKNNGTAFSAEKEKAKLSPSSLPVSASEKAAYEVFKRGDISRATIEGWLRNDLRSVHALVSEILHDNDLFAVLSDKYYARYRDLVEKQKLDQ